MRMCVLWLPLEDLQILHGGSDRQSQILVIGFGSGQWRRRRVAHRPPIARRAVAEGAGTTRKEYSTQTSIEARVENCVTRFPEPELEELPRATPESVTIPAPTQSARPTAVEPLAVSSFRRSA